MTRTSVLLLLACLLHIGCSTSTTNSRRETSTRATTRPSSSAGINAVSNEETDTCPVTLKPHSGVSSISPTIPKSSMALLLLLGFGGFSLLTAGGYKAIRKYVYHDDQNLDTVFDAGGRVSFSLTAVTVTSQMLWPADFLQSSTLTSKSGLGGSLWMTIGIVIDILFFPTLSIYLKTRAPGAKTFPQIAYARFGKTAHILFCILALVTNIVTTSMLLAGKSAIEVLGKDVNNEFIYLLLAVLFGSYCMIGGLGTTFYISYFNTALIYISVTVYILMTTFYPSDEMKSISSIESLYKAASCLKAPDGNFENSYLTFRTTSGVIYGVVLLFMATSISFCDQANWQSRIAAKPSEGVTGFFMAAYMWLVIPVALSFTATMTYFSLSLQNGTHLLSQAEIDNGLNVLILDLRIYISRGEMANVLRKRNIKADRTISFSPYHIMSLYSFDSVILERPGSGYITPYVMNHLLGDTGGYLLLTMLMMALMSTGSGEVMAVSSIIVYDIYKTYIYPFRKNLTPTSCILCGKEKIIQLCDNDEKNLCDCPSIGCKGCEVDIANRVEKGFESSTYSCTVHGKYRQYEDGLMRYKSWCMVWVVILLVPYGMLVSETGMNVNWATLGSQALTSPFLWPLFLTITWSKATAQGVISGGISGLVCSVAGMLIMGSTYEGGLSNFYVNTAESYSLLTAMLSGFVISCVVCVLVSLCTHKIKSEEDSELEWARTINIDNPLNPFRLIYEEELKAVDAGPVITAKTMDNVFRKVKKYALIGGISSIVLFLVVIPAIALSFEVLDFDQFSAWLKTFQIYCFICTVIVVVLPPIEEGMQILKRFARDKQKRATDASYSDKQNNDLFHSVSSERL